MTRARRRNSQRNREVLEGRRLLSGYQSLFRKGGFREGRGSCQAGLRGARGPAAASPPTSGDELVGMPQRPGGSTQ